MSKCQHLLCTDLLAKPAQITHFGVSSRRDSAIRGESHRSLHKLGFDGNFSPYKGEVAILDYFLSRVGGGDIAPLPICLALPLAAYRSVKNGPSGSVIKNYK